MKEVENNMNAVERVTFWSSDNLEQEAPHELTHEKLDAAWPSRGALSFQNIVMAYRKDLPPVLKGM